MPKTTTFANALLDHIRGGASYTPPAQLYAALFTTSPTVAGGGTEVSGGSYARVAVTFGAAGSAKMSNSARLDFPQATANWGTVVAVAIMDASTGGTILQFDSLPVSRTVVSGDQPYFLAGEVEWDEA